MRAGYGEIIRGYLANKNPIQLIDFSGFRVFESATVDTNILIVQNSLNTGKLQAAHFKNDFQKDQNIGDYFNANKITLSKPTDNAWYIGSSIEQKLKEKMEHIGSPLKDWDVKIHMGIRTGLNEAFIIDDTTRDGIIERDSNSIDIIKPIIRGRDIRRYGYERSGLYVLTIGYGDYKTLRQNYPAIFAHLQKYQTKLKNRGQCKASRSGKRLCPDYEGQHHWLELDNNPKKEYFNEFEKEKIAWIDLADEGRFSKIERGIYLDKTLFFLTGSNIEYLLGILNSKLINWYFDTICSSSGVGTNLWSKISIEPLPVPKITSDIVDKAERLNRLVEQAGQIKDPTTTTDYKLLEHKIDQIVYELYGLTPDEIAIVEGQIGKEEK